MAKDEFLPDVFESLVKANPNRELYHWLNKNGEVAKLFTRGQLWKRACGLAKLLTETHKLKHGDRVLIVYPGGIDFMVSMLACFLSGIIAVSIYPPNPSHLKSDIQKLEHFAQDSGAEIALTNGFFKNFVNATGTIQRTKWPKSIKKWIVTDDYNQLEAIEKGESYSFVSRACKKLRVVPSKKTKIADTPSLTSQLPDHQMSAYQEHEDLEQAYPRESFRHKLERNDIAFIQYTSGSTGNPKGKYEN